MECGTYVKVNIALNYNHGVLWLLICSHVLEFTFTFKLPSHARAYKLLILTQLYTKRFNLHNCTCVDNGDPEQNEIRFIACRRHNDVSNEQTHVLMLNLMIDVFY